MVFFVQGLSREWGKCMVLDNTCQGCQKFAWQTLPFVFSVRSKSRQGIRDRPRWDQPKNRGVVETPRPQTNAPPFSQFRNCENRDVCEVFRFREILGRVSFLICSRISGDFWKPYSKLPRREQGHLVLQLTIYILTVSKL